VSAHGEADEASYHDCRAARSWLLGDASRAKVTPMIKIGDALPDATVYESLEMGEACPIRPSSVRVSEASRGKRIVIFGLPGAYTPTCSAQHVPGYVANLAALKGRGVDEVWCVSVNDGYVMAAWGASLGALGKVRMLGDGSAEFVKALGLELDLTKAGMGLRSSRFSLLVDQGIVKQVNVEASGKFEVSNAETMLAQLA
jgi:peroxiredoxin